MCDLVEVSEAELRGRLLAFDFNALVAAKPNGFYDYESMLDAAVLGRPGQTFDPPDQVERARVF